MLLGKNEVPFPDNVHCKRCASKNCRELLVAPLNPGKVIFVHRKHFCSIPDYIPTWRNEESVQEAAAPKTVAETDDLEVVEGTVEVSSPAWKHKDEDRLQSSPDATAEGDTISISAQVKNFPEGAPVTFDVYDVTDGTPFLIKSVKGNNSEGIATAEWVVEDPQKKGEALKLAFEASAKSKSSGKLDIPFKKASKLKCDYVEMPGALLHHSSAVPCLDSEGTFLGGLSATFSFAKSHSDRELVIFGHADTSGDPAYNYDISQWRAEGIKSYLDNDVNAFLDIVDMASKVEDYQMYLSTLSESHGWDCNPGKIDNVAGPNTKAAVKRFQEEYNKKFSGNLTVDGVVGPKTWTALFKVTRSLLETNVKKECGEIPALKYGYNGKGFYACGESFPLDKAGQNDTKSVTNRRVENVFMEQGKSSVLKAPADKKKVTAEDAPVYDSSKAEKTKIPVKQPDPGKKPKVTFSEDKNHSGGYDVNETINGEDQNGTATAEIPATKYDFVSIEKGSTGTISFVIKDGAKEEVFFTSDKEDVAVPLSGQPDADSGILKIQAKDNEKAETVICARYKSKSGEILAKVGVVVLKKISYEAELFRIKDGKSAGTALSLNSVTGNSITEKVKQYYKQAISEMIVAGGTSEVDSDYDTNAVSVKNGSVDLEPGVESEEQKIIKKISGKSAKTAIVYVHNLRWSYFLREDALKDSNTIKLKNYGSTYLGYIGTNQYTIANEDGTTEVVTVKSINTSTGDMVIDGKLNHTFTTAKKSVLIWPLGGLSGNPVWVSDVGTEDDLANYCAHELGHELAKWKDVCETDNVMFGGSTTGKKFRHRPLKNYYDTSKTSTQWTSMNKR
jgi:hypothetical protein